MLLKNETASLKLEIVCYEFPEVEPGMDEYDRNWLVVRGTWTDEEGLVRKDSNPCLLAQELSEMNAGLKVLSAGIKTFYESDFIEPSFSLAAQAEETGDFRVDVAFYLPNTMDGEDTAELTCTLTGEELKTLIRELDKACLKFPERK